MINHTQMTPQEFKIWLRGFLHFELDEEEFEAIEQEFDKMYYGTVSVPADLCTDGGLHEYNFYWGGMNPQPCKKCGKVSSSYTINCNQPIV